MNWSVWKRDGRCWGALWVLIFMDDMETTRIRFEWEKRKAQSCAHNLGDSCAIQLRDSDGAVIETYRATWRAR